LINGLFKLSVPATEPKLLVHVSLPGSERQQLEPPALLRSEDDGYVVSISFPGASQPELENRSMLESVRELDFPA
jgi:hypothetical protein